MNDIIFVILMGILTADTGQPYDNVPEIVTGNYERITRVTELPDAILKFIKRIDKPCPGMAEKGGDFNSTDVIRGNLLCQRLLDAGHIGDIWLVHYVLGGFGYSINQDVYQVVDGKVINAWAYNDENPLDVEILLKYIADKHVCLSKLPRWKYRKNLSACRELTKAN